MWGLYLGGVWGPVKVGCLDSPGTGCESSKGQSLAIIETGGFGEGAGWGSWELFLELLV